MSLIGDAQEFLYYQKPQGTNTQFPPRGGVRNVSASYITGRKMPSRPEQDVSQQYTTLKEAREGERAAGIMATPALTEPITGNVPEPSELSEGKKYLGIGAQGLEVGGKIAETLGAADIGSVMKNIGRAAGKVAGILGAGISAYNIIKGEGKHGDYANLTVSTVPYIADAAQGLYEVATLGSEIPAITGTAGSAGSSLGASTAGSLGSTVGSVVGGAAIAAPYYAAAKAGGLIQNLIIANNPSLKKTPFGWSAASIEEPLDVEGGLAEQAAFTGVGDNKTNRFIANAVNPIGGMTRSAQAGNWKGVGKAAQARMFTDAALIGTSTLAPLVAPAIAPLLPFAPLAFAKKKEQRIAAGILSGGLSEIFCFAEGTPITMADGTTKPVEQIDLFDVCEGGGMVNGKGVVIAEDIYDYEGVMVTGGHAVYEDNKWIRVKDSEKSILVALEEPIKVYIVNNEEHVLIINDIIFADYGEVTDSENMTADERLAYLNDNCSF